MNYWPRWIGSIQKKTAQLSLAEMGAYDRLLDHYYAQERPLPSSVERCCRIAGAGTRDERKAVETVLAEFFTLTDEGYTQDRADQEIAEAQPKLEAARTNGAKGGRPKGSGKKPNEKPTGFPAGTQDESSTPSETTSLPTVERKARKRAACLPCPDGVNAQTWDDFLSLRKTKKAPVTTTVLEGAQAEAVKAGMTLEAFLRVWCTRGTQGLQADWLKPHERGQQADPPEPTWRREQRERNEAFLGPAAARRNTPTTIDMEPADAASYRLG